jgi:hypothetical protein
MKELAEQFLALHESHKMNEVFILFNCVDIFNVLPSCFKNVIQRLNGSEHVSVVFALNSNLVKMIRKPFKKYSHLLFCHLLNLVGWFSCIKSKLTKDLLSRRVKWYTLDRASIVDEINQAVKLVVRRSAPTVGTFFVVFLNFLLALLTNFKEHFVFVDFHQINAK